MFIAVARDLSFDLALESEARTILTVFGIAVGVLLLATVVILRADLFRKLGRYIFGTPNPISNQTPGQVTVGSESIPTMLHSRPIPHPRPEQRPNQARRITAFFAAIRKNTSVPPRPTGLYQGANGTYHSPAYVSHSPRSLPPVTFVSPHIVGWMQVADSVVGQHPNAQPLSSRIATQAEIDMISEHVHIPWAFNDFGRPQPIPVKVQKPVPVYPVEPLKDVGNLRAHGRAIFDTVSHAAKRSSKGKAIRQPRGKEDIPPPSFFASHRT